MTIDVKKPHPAYAEMAKDWALPDALNGGTPAMRAANKTFLSQEPRESGAAYNIRLNRSFLFSGYSSTVKMLSAKPFQKEITLSSDVSPQLTAIIDDIDLGGCNVSKFASNVFKDAMNHGLSHILIDMPARDVNEHVDKASQAALNIRPYFVHVTAESLINWTSERRNGVQVLTSATIATKTWRNKGNTQEQVFVYTVIYETQIDVYEAMKQSETPKLVKSTANTLGVVPLVTHYANRTGFMTGKPPLTDLAYTNLAHWQSGSDQRNILRVARVPFLLATGFDSEQATDGDGIDIAGTSELESVLTVSPNSMAASTNEKANLRFVEHGGSGIEAGERDLAMLKEEMAIQGATFILPKKGNTTATEYKGNSGSIQSELQAIVVCFQDTLNTAMVFVHKWLGIEEPDYKLEVHKDFNASLEDKSSVDLLLKARQAGQITQKTFLTELKRRNILADSFDLEAELDESKEDDLFVSATQPTGN